MSFAIHSRARPLPRTGRASQRLPSPQFVTPRTLVSTRSAATGSSPVPDDAASSSGAQQPQGESMLDRIKNFFSNKKDKEKLASLGLAAFASYGVVSNVTYGACLTIAWVTFVKQKGVSPLAEGQWPVFLAFYAGIWTIQNFVRPARFALAIAMAPMFDRLMDWMGQKLGVGKKVAFVILLVFIAAFTSTGLFSAIYFLGGFPDGVPLPWFKK